MKNLIYRTAQAQCTAVFETKTQTFESAFLNLAKQFVFHKDMRNELGFV